MVSGASAAAGRSSEMSSRLQYPPPQWRKHASTSAQSNSFRITRWASPFTSSHSPGRTAARAPSNSSLSSAAGRLQAPGSPKDCRFSPGSPSTPPGRAGAGGEGRGRQAGSGGAREGAGAVRALGLTCRAVPLEPHFSELRAEHFGLPRQGREADKAHGPLRRKVEAEGGVYAQAHHPAAQGGSQSTVGPLWRTRLLRPRPRQSDRHRS